MTGIQTNTLLLTTPKLGSSELDRLAMTHPNVWGIPPLTNAAGVIGRYPETFQAGTAVGSWAVLTDSSTADVHTLRTLIDI